MKDTPPAIERKFHGMLMQRSGAERLKMGCSMHATAQALAKAYISGQHPDARLAQLKRLLFLHFYGADFKPQQRKRIVSALSKRRRRANALEVVKPKARKLSDLTDSVIAKLSLVGVVGERGEKYGKRENNKSKRSRPSSR